MYMRQPTIDSIIPHANNIKQLIPVYLDTTPDIINKININAMNCDV